MKTERRKLRALAATFLFPGLGQIYVGNWSKGLLVGLVFNVWIVLFCYVSILVPTRLMLSVLVLGLLGLLFLFIWACVDATRSARKQNVDYELKGFNSWFVYVSYFLAMSFFVSRPVIQYVRSDFVEAYKVPSESMIPSVQSGDHILVDKNYNKPMQKPVRRGDVVVFVQPNNRTTIYIKRILGLPGDTVEFKGADVWVNGKSIGGEKSESGLAYSVTWDPNVQVRADSKVTVPNGMVFCVGDNRDHTNDSRNFGPVPIVDIIGKVKQVWLSPRPEGGFRWDRIGTVLDVNP